MSEAPTGAVLGTVERVSEMCFGLFMALTFVGAVSAATSGQEEKAAMTMFYTALGCNLAWGLVDAVMFLVRTLTDRGKRLTIAMHVRAAPDEASAERVLRAELPPMVAKLIGDDELKAMRKHLVTERLPEKPHFEARDFRGAFGIFVIVVLSTFPVALPFVIVKDVPTALLISRILSVLMLFGGGYALGRHAGYSGLKAGFGMAVMGVVLTMAVIALGG